jgi:hypothetical protein
MKTFKSEFSEGFSEPHKAPLMFSIILYLVGLITLGVTVSIGAAVGVFLLLWAHNMTQARDVHKAIEKAKYEMRHSEQ